MIIGSGLIASAFSSFAASDKSVVFASGVSNSSSPTEADFQREQRLLEAQRGTSGRLVYFSTCSLHDPTLHRSPYILHKLRMEERVRTIFPDHLILRLPNLLGRTPNPHTLCNHIRNSVLAGTTLHVHAHACRYLMDVDTMYAACQGLVPDPAMRAATVDVCFDRPVRVPDLVAAMEEVLGKRARMALEDRGACYHADNTVFKAHWPVAELGPWPAADPWQAVIRKYYGAM